MASSLLATSKAPQVAPTLPDTVGTTLLLSCFAAVMHLILLLCAGGSRLIDWHGQLHCTLRPAIALHLHAFWCLISTARVPSAWALVLVA